MQRSHVRRGPIVKIDDIVPAATVDRVIALMRRDMKHIIAFAAVQGVATRSRPNAVIAGTAVNELVLAVAGVNQIVASAAHERVVGAVTTIKRIAAIARTQELVTAGPRHEGVGAAAAINTI